MRVRRRRDRRLLAARLEAAGTPGLLVARGAHLAAVQQDGLVLHSGGERIVTRPNAVAHGDAIGPQDYLILTLKAHSVEPALPQLAPLVGPGHHDRDRDQRRALVVQLRPARTVRRPQDPFASIPPARCARRCRPRNAWAPSSIRPPPSTRPA